MNELLILDSHDAVFFKAYGNAIKFSWHLAEPYQFPEPYSARLWSIGGIEGKGDCLILADFCKPQIHNKGRLPILAFHSAANQGQQYPWVPLNSRELSQTGQIAILLTREDAIKAQGRLVADQLAALQLAVNQLAAAQLGAGQLAAGQLAAAQPGADQPVPGRRKTRPRLILFLELAPTCRIGYGAQS